MIFIQGLTGDPQLQVVILATSLPPPCTSTILLPSVERTDLVSLVGSSSCYPQNPPPSTILDKIQCSRPGIRLGVYTTRLNAHPPIRVPREPEALDNNSLHA